MKINHLFKKDAFRKSRGGRSTLLQLACSHCEKPLCVYQKDGPGVLKRLYLDRMHPAHHPKKTLECTKCKTVLGIYITYKKENRPAYRLFVGAITKTSKKRS